MKTKRSAQWVLSVSLILSLTPAGMAYTGATISVYDIQSSDVPGPQPIRTFPVPAATGWTDATLIYDNYAESLGFSASINYADFNWVSLPLGNANVTINGVSYASGVTNLAVDNGFQLFTNEEGDDGDPRGDNRFPYHIPRPSRYCGDWFTAVQFDLASPAAKFGVFLPRATNSYNPADPLDDHNFEMMSQTVHLFVQGEGESFSQAQYQTASLSTGPGGSYCPFLTVQWNQSDPIKAVTIIHDCYAGHAPTFGFMDIYTSEPAPPLPGDANYDGWVEGIDYTIWADNYDPGTPGKTWEEGDFSGDGYVDAADYTIWADNYTGPAYIPPPPQPAPEPATLVLLGASALLLRRRR